MKSLRTLLLGALLTASTLLPTAAQAEAIDDDDAGYGLIINEIQRQNNQSLLWGPYRPQVYFGVKPRLPDSLIAGLMWSGVNDYGQVRDNFRHTCEQSDDVDGYGWEEYDVRLGGRQVIRDKGNKIDIEIEWRKVEGGEHGGHWGARIKGTPRADAPKDLTTSLWFYAGLEGDGTLELDNEPDKLGLEGDVQLLGKAPGLGKFSIEITTGPKTNVHPEQLHQASWAKPLDRTLYAAFDLPGNIVWKTKDILFQHMQEYLSELSKRFGKEHHPPPWDSLTLGNTFEGGNLHMVQKVFVGAFQFDVLYSAGSAGGKMTPSLLTNTIKSFNATFQQQFEKSFDLQEPFNTPEYKTFAHNMFSNLAGGIGYFHGTSLVDKSYAAAYDEDEEGFWEGAADALRNADAQYSGPHSLFTSIPSRPYFPRGFYWDEGFHLLPILDWDVDVTLEIVKSWFSQVDADGWIAREQILGDEARSKVPSEFQIQYPHYANPPTLFIVLNDYMTKLDEVQKEKERREKIEAEMDTPVLGGFGADLPQDLQTAHLCRPLAIKFLRTLYPALRKHYLWFRRTQAGDLKTWERNARYPKEGYRWRGHTMTHCLTSGLDDYPRATPPHTGELHVDLISWMSLMTRVMRKIAIVLNENEDLTDYIQSEVAINRNIDSLHWSEEHQIYCDVTVDDYEESVHVCHKGYVSLFPFLVGGIIAPDSDRLKPVLDFISNPDEIWTPYGLRSLSKNDAFYGVGENYWRGAIWININYLALRRLYEYARVPGPQQKQARTIYLDLRKNLVENIYNEWKRTGFAWEQYNDETGKGQRTKHFLGWTSLVVKIMAMPGTISLVQTEYMDWAQ